MEAAKLLNSLHPQQLVALLRVYDVKNISRLINRLPEDERQEAVESMVMEAMARDRDPAQGSVGTILSLLHTIQSLHHQIERTEITLNSLPRLPSSDVDIHARKNSKRGGF